MMRFHEVVYLSWLIPSCISISFSLAVVITQFAVPRLRQHLFNKLLLLLHISDIIQCLSWIIFPKYLSSFPLCIFQEFLLQYGTAMKACATVSICAVSYYVIKHLKAPASTSFYSFVAACTIIPVFIVAISFYFESYRLFCRGNDSERDEDNRHHDPSVQLTAYAVVFLGFIYTCVVLDLAMFVFVTRRVQQILGQGTSFPVTHTEHLQQVSRNLKYYPLIFGICWLPELIFLILWETHSSLHIAAFVIAGVFASISGAAFAVTFFRGNPNTLLYWRKQLLRKFQAEDDISPGLGLVSSGASQSVNDTVASEYVHEDQCAALPPSTYGSSRQVSVVSVMDPRPHDLHEYSTSMSYNSYATNTITTASPLSFGTSRHDSVLDETL